MPPTKPPRPAARRAPQPAPDPSSTLVEDGGAADPNSTVLDAGAPPPRRPAGARLSVTGGPKVGSEFTLGSGETSIGRQGDNTIVIPDISVSRKHIVIRKEGASYILVDQGSGNGTQLNGVRVEAETELQDGDLIVMGDTELTFLAARAAGAARPAPRPAPPRRASAPPRAPVRRAPAAPLASPEVDEVTFDPEGAQRARRKKLLMIGGALVLVLGLLLAFKVRQDKIAAARRQAEQFAAISERRDEMLEFYEAGKKATAARDFRAAVAQLKQAIAVAQEIEDDDRDLQRRLEICQREIKNQDILESARELGERKELAAAAEKLKEIPDDSLVADKVGELLEEMKGKVAGRLSDGRAAFDEKNYELARAAVTDVLAVDPENAQAAALSQDIEKAGQPAPRVPVPRTPRVQEDPTAKAQESFKGGRLDEAIGMAAACDDPKCAAYKEKLVAFRDAYNNLERDPARAVTTLRAIPGGASSPFMQKVGQAGSANAVKEGVAAMSAKNYPKAFAAFRQVLAVDSGNEVARRHLGTIAVKAKELTEQAYIDMTQDPDKARRGLELILQITEPGSELNTKAKNRLHKLQGGGFD